MHSDIISESDSSTKLESKSINGNIRILQIVTFFSANNGGAPTSAQGVFHKLQTEGYDANVFVSGDCALEEAPLYCFEFDDANVKVIKRKKNRRFGHFLKVKEVIQLYRLIQSCDLVLLHQLFTLTNIYAFILCNLFGRKYVLMPHGSLTQYDLSHHSIRKKVALALFYRNLLKSAYAIFVATEQEKEQVSQEFDLSIYVVGLGFPENKSKLTRVNNLMFNDFLFMGRITRKKRPDLMLKAFDQLVSEGLDMKLVIAGLADKEISAEVSQIQTELKNPDNFLFTGWLSGKEKHEVFAQSKYHVLISDDENFAVAIAESLSYGKPVLVSSKVALSEFVARYNCGVVVEDLTIESVLKGFRILCELDYELLSHNALQASKSLTWDSVWINWDRALKQIIQ